MASSFTYASRDFNTIRADLLARATTVFPDWTDRDPSDFGMLLVDLWAHSADTLHYYIDRAANEAFINTATQRESMLAIANLLDYVPEGIASATASLTLQNTSAVQVAIPAYTAFSARSDGKSYQAFSTVAASVSALSTAAINVTEGTRYVEEVLTTSASGTAGQIYNLSRTNVAPYTIQCYVYEDGVARTQYQFVNNLVYAATGDRVFTVYAPADGSVQISFGTALNGFIPPSGAKVTATYVQSSGAAGNIPGNTITGFSGVTPIGITVISNTGFSGGADAESIASLRNTIPSTVAAQNRAVTRNDFIALSLQVPGVAKSSLSFAPGISGGASIGTNASVTIFPQVSRADYLTTTDTFQAVSSTMQTSVVSILQPLALLGVTVVSATTVQWQPIDVIVTVNVTNRYVQAWVKQNVSDALDQLFAFDNVFFGQLMTLGQVYQIIQNVAGVQYATVTRFDNSGSTGVQSSILVDPLKLPKKGTVTFNMVGGTTTNG